MMDEERGVRRNRIISALVNSHCIGSAISSRDLDVAVLEIMSAGTDRSCLFGAASAHRTRDLDDDPYRPMAYRKI
jgi:hypothetical protein